jgi:hypothetical protein
MENETSDRAPSRREALRKSTGLAAAAAFIAAGCAAAPVLLAGPARARTSSDFDYDEPHPTGRLDASSGDAMAVLRGLDGRTVKLLLGGDGSVAVLDQGGIVLVELGGPAAPLRP